MKIISCAAGLSLLASAGLAGEICDINTELSVTHDLLERSVILVEYGDVLIRAASGTVRCEELAEQGRLACYVDMPAELLVDAPDRALQAIVFHTDVPAEAHIYPTGDLSCASVEEFDKYH